MKNFLLGCLSLLLVATTNAQPKHKSGADPEDKLAYEQIRSLKNGVLLVRLQSKSKAIDALQKMGQKEQAELVEKMQRRKNKNIIRAFKENYQFSDVYFFYSDQTDALVNKRFGEVNFLNQDLQPDNSINLSGRDYMIADYGTLKRSTFTVEDKRTRQSRTFTDGSNVEVSALVLKNDKFDNVERPFPVSVRTYQSLEIEPEKAIKKLNKRLHKFYYRTSAS